MGISESVTRASFRLLDDAAPTFRSDRVAAFHRHWLDLCSSAGGLPGRDAIDPAALRALLPYLMIVDLEDAAGALRIRYRLVGTAITKFAGLDFTGAYLDELDFDLCTTDDLTRAYHAIRAAGRPGLGLAYAQLENDQVMDVEYLICPLAGADGVIRQCVAIEDYTPSANYDVDRNKLGRRSG